MKKVITTILMLLTQICFIAVITLNADAASSVKEDELKTGNIFQLRNGQLSGEGLGVNSHLRQHLMETNFYDTGEKYQIDSNEYDSFQIKASSTGKTLVPVYRGDNISGEINTWFNCIGYFDPQTGIISGTWFYRQIFDGSEITGGDIKTVYTVDSETANGKFMGFAEPGDTSVELTFVANETAGDPRDIAKQPKTFDGYQIELIVKYNVQGSLPFDKPLPANEDSGIRLSDMEGRVDVLFPVEYDIDGVEQYNKTAWESAKPDMELPYSTMIRTGSGSSFKLTYPDGTSFEARGECVVKLPKDPSIGPNPIKDINRVMLMQGQLWGGVGKNSLSCTIKNGPLTPLTIDMSQCLVEITGTSLVLEDDGSTSDVKVAEGNVDVSSKADGETITLSEGQMVSVTAKGLGEKKSFDISDTQAPNGVSFQSGARMSWDPYPDAIGYRLYRSKSKGSIGISVTDFYITSLSYADVNVEPNTTYYYTLRPVLAEANPYKGIEEKLGPVMEIYTIKTGDTTYKPGTIRSSIILRLDDPYLSKNGIKAEIDPGRGTKPIIIASRTMVPIRAIVEAMGGTVGWDPNTQKITLTARGNTVEMWIGKADIYVNGTAKKMDVTPLVRNDRTFVPVRFAAENMNCQVDWINSTKEAVIIYEE